jgi:DNA primase small subunit
MRVNEESFLRERFASYYRQHAIAEPPAIEKREFGTGSFGKKISQRHLSFPSHETFNDFLQKETPLFVSYSAAYYQEPAARPMEAKHWQGADLVFEFDADDLKTDCKLEHDSWECTQCHATGKGNQEACTQCGSGVKTNEWVCPECLKAVWRQAEKLLDLLEIDLGFSDGIALNFSGSKGIHIHVRSELARKLSPNARIEVLDFLTGQGLDLQQLGFVERNKTLYGPPFSRAKGWQKRIEEAVLELIEKNEAERLAVAGNISVRNTEKMLEKRESMTESIRKGIFPAVTSKPASFWGSVLTFVSDELKLDIDRQTSLDKFKIVRVPQTLHGSTGLLANKLEPENWKEFNALNDSVVFGDSPCKVRTSKTPRFFLRNQWFGPFSNQEEELPEFAAVFLLGRGAAALVG